MDPFLGFLAVVLGFSDKKSKRIVVKRKKSLDEIIDEHFEGEKNSKK